MDRKELQKELNDLNEKFQQTRKEMMKAGASNDQIQRLHDMRQIKEKELLSRGDDLNRLNIGQNIRVNQATTLGELPQSGLPDMSKVKNLGKEEMWKKASRLSKSVGKGVKAVPIIGSALGLASAISSGDASAAIPVLDAADNVGEGSDQVQGLEPAFPVRDEYEGQELSPEQKRRFDKLKGLMR